MKTRFFLILSRAARTFEYELTCAISGDPDGWQSKSRHFSDRKELETALSGAGIIPAVGPYQLLDAAGSSIPVAFSLESASGAVELQVLNRLDPERKREKTMVTFNDLNGGLVLQTAHYERDRPITVGEKLEVDTAFGKRVVEVLAIKKDKVVPYGSHDTRREMTVDVRF